MVVWEIPTTHRLQKDGVSIIESSVCGRFFREGKGFIKSLVHGILAKTQIARKLDVIAVWKLDRFGRSLRHLVDALAELNAVGCAFVSLRDNLDLTTPAGRMMFHVIGAMAEFERELIRERVKAGLAHARAKGQKLGRPKIKRERDKDAKVIRQMRADGDSYGEIAEALGGSKADVYRVCMTLGCFESPNGPVNLSV